MDTLKMWLKWAATPFLLMAGAIFYLLQSRRTLQDEVKDLKEEKAVEAVKQQISEADKDANSAESDYRRVAAEYLQQSGPGGTNVPGRNQ